MKKTFDCVEMKRRGAERMRQRTAGMTKQQEIAYWQQRSEQFQAEQDQFRARSKPRPRRREPSSR